MRRPVLVGVAALLWFSGCSTSDKSSAGASSDPVATVGSAPRAIAPPHESAVVAIQASVPSPSSSAPPLSPAAAARAKASLPTDPSGNPLNMWASPMGDSFGHDGLGLSGIGESGPGRGEGIGLGSIGTMGRGAGTRSGDGSGSGMGRLGGAHRAKPPRVTMGATTVVGPLPPEVIQRIVRQSFGRFRLCYENGLRSNPTLEGEVDVVFTIGKDGSVSDVHDSGSMPDADVKSCVIRGFAGVAFPEPEGNVVKVTYPIHFAPGDDALSSAKLAGKALVDVRADDVKASLEKAGCTEVTRKENPTGVTSPTIFTAKKDGRLVTITFVGANDPALTAVDVAKLRDTGAVRQEGGFLLVVSCDGDTDKSAAGALLNTLIVAS